MGNERYLLKDFEPIYTAASELPIDHSATIVEAIKHQDELQSLYNGGALFDVRLSKSLSSWKEAALIVKNIALHSHLPYFTLSPRFSVCPSHKYLSGELSHCPICKTSCENYLKIDGAIWSIDRLNNGIKDAFKISATFDESILNFEQDLAKNND